MSGIKFSNMTPVAPGGMSLVTFQADGQGNISAAYTPGGGGASNSSLAVAQTAHGFSVGQAIYYTGTAWALAKANAVGTLGLGIVSAVADANDFTVMFSGYVTGLSALTAGQYYFVSDSVAGSLVATEPTATTSYSNPLLFALSATQGVVLPFRPSQIAVIPNIVSATGNVTAAAGQIILCNTTGGGFTVTLPLSANNVTQTVIIKKISSDANAVTIARTSTDLIDGATSQTIVGQYVSMTVLADGGTNWEII